MKIPYEIPLNLSEIPPSEIKEDVEGFARMMYAEMWRQAPRRSHYSPAHPLPAFGLLSKAVGDVGRLLYQTHQWETGHRRQESEYQDPQEIAEIMQHLADVGNCAMILAKIYNLRYQQWLEGPGKDVPAES